MFVTDANETDRALTVWEISGEPERIATFHLEDSADSLSLSADGRRVAVKSVFSGYVRVWDVDAGTEVMTLTGHTGMVTASRYSDDGRWIFSTFIV